MQRIGLPETWGAREADPGFMASLATFSFVALGLELVVDGTVLTYTGSAPALYPLGWQCLVWVGLGLAWLLVARGLVAWSRRRGLDPLPADPDPRAAGNTPDDAALVHRAWRSVLLCFAAVVVAITLPALVGVPWGLVSADRYRELYASYGGSAWLAVCAWVVYHVGRCVVVAGFLAYAHRAVRGVATFRGSHAVPWGGLVAGVAMGAVALLSRGPVIALTTVVVHVLIGLIHVRSGESLRVTALFTVLVLALL
ncbi:hypothetical protein EAE32_08500 [Kocuria tytonicola]|uniref:CPBP family intramembrane metalloprotease n=1 Tax=Kocuria tytonicola TaxID=2055946 RepID=A0A3L9KZV7_9MICC|nr:hypothetical protein [Kocuria tytonicola]RLY92193.1 hypothetical protein EAE32_08500 [Kocuria tytonicola]